MHKTTIFIGLLACFAVIFGFLSHWQWTRYHEKLTIIANPPPLKTMQGQFVADKYVQLTARTMSINNQAAQIGYDVVALFVNDVNEHYIVHLGFQPFNTQYMPPNEKITLQFTEHQATKGYFQPDNNPQKSLFYYINLDELAQIWGVQLASRAILYSENTGEIFPTPRKNPIINNHFGYFLTWAGLAMICVAFMGIIYYNHKKLRTI